MSIHQQRKHSLWIGLYDRDSVAPSAAYCHSQLLHVMASALPIIDPRAFSTVEELAPELMRVGKHPGFFYLTGHEQGEDEVCGQRRLRRDTQISGMRIAEHDMLFFSSSLAGKGHGDLKESYYLANPDAGCHTDYGTITLLFRQPSDQGGQQTFINNQLIDISYIRDAIVANMDYALEFWTCGRLRSTTHRVVFPRNGNENIDRLSMPFFVQPDRIVLLEPIMLGEVDRDEFKGVLRRKGYPSARPLTAEEYLKQRLRATYRY
ncbi:hypothetical protein ACJ73_01884 [Blastomyces percursus]|uniref:Fe2OG dioxygenase domain-containing protein n=1 Tax=Blastomyces percursus TaxID=1658174 RepID=A0A1J9QDX6_9EURO|nr:hypothetical protein ACJ73_01884 [Blastomyces percursus]